MKAIGAFILIHFFLSLPSLAQHQGMKQMQTPNRPAPSADSSHNTPSKNIIRYLLYISDTMVNYTGKKVRAMAINGSIPAPTLYFTEGDTAEIYVHNNMKMETSIHWHGLILPNQYDGVSYLTTRPIEPGETHLYRFALVQNGTYWYHSHTMFQQQSGMYGAFIIRKKEEPPMKDFTVLLSDWTNQNPAQVDRSLHNATDWYAIRKGSTQNYAQAIREGYLKTKVTNEWKRMLAMDVSDVAYDRVFINGKTDPQLPDINPREKIRLHLVNGSSSTYFWLTYAGGKIMVVASDGKDVVPVEVDRMMIGVAETYDVILTIPDRKSYAFLATSEDRTKSVSLWLGGGEKAGVSPLPRLNYFEGMKMMNGMMKMNGDMQDMGMQMSFQQMDMNTVMYREMTGDDTSMKTNDIVTLNYAQLRSPEKTNLPEGPTRLLRFNLTGNMNRYVWSINNKTVSEADTILIRKGENVKIILYNGTMMRHPMHLHGHFFRVLNGQGDYSPLKNTLDIMPMETDSLELAATESGDWFFHCHILYHMMSGMGRIFRYENSPPNPEAPDPEMRLKMVYMDDKRWHPGGKAGVESNGSEGKIMLSNTRWQATSLWHVGYTDIQGYESETMIGRYLGKMQWWLPYIGFDYHFKKTGGPKNLFGNEEKNLFGQISDKNDRKAVVAGIAYTLPLLFVADARIDDNGKFRFQLGREDIAVTSRLRLTLMINTDKEYTAGLRYIISKNIGVSTHYDSDMGLGAGITLSY